MPFLPIQSSPDKWSLLFQREEPIDPIHPKHLREVVVLADVVLPILVDLPSAVVLQISSPFLPLNHHLFQCGRIHKHITDMSIRENGEYDLQHKKLSQQHPFDNSVYIWLLLPSTKALYLVDQDYDHQSQGEGDCDD